MHHHYTNACQIQIKAGEEVVYTEKQTMGEINSHTHISYSHTSLLVSVAAMAHPLQPYKE